MGAWFIGALRWRAIGVSHPIFGRKRPKKGVRPQMRGVVRISISPSNCFFQVQRSAVSLQLWHERGEHASPVPHNRPPHSRSSPWQGADGRTLADGRQSLFVWKSTPSTLKFQGLTSERNVNVTSLRSFQLFKYFCLRFEP